MLRRDTTLRHTAKAQLASLDAYIDHDSHAEAAAALGISLRTHKRHMQALRDANTGLPTHRLVAIRAQERGVTPRRRASDPDQDGLWAA